MNVTKVITDLTKQYPKKTIIKNHNSMPTEIICEIEPARADGERSRAIAIIDRSILHYHKKARETYRVLKGTLILFKMGKRYVLKEGEQMTIQPMETHCAEGDETVVEVESQPGWTKEDHCAVDK